MAFTNPLNPSALDCFFCGKHFPDFTTLALHVKQTCLRRGAQSVPAGPGLQSTKRRTMAARTTQRQTSQRRPAVPSFDETPAKASSESKESDRPEILTPEHLGKSRSGVLVFTGDVNGYKSKYGEGFFFGVTLNGQRYDLRVRVNSQNYPLIKELAPTVAKLRGKSVDVEVQNFNDNDYIAIV
jgi:hypothetical protein